MYYGHADSIDKNDKRQKKWKKQRKQRGFDSTELWNLDVTITKFVLPRLKAFKEEIIGYPANLSEKKWDKILDKIIAAFEILSNEDPFLYDDEKVDNGLKLFAKYYNRLWD